MNYVYDFCSAIKRYEGWKVGSRSYRNCNPGNLRYTRYTQKYLGATGADGSGFCIFNTPQEGFGALVKFVSQAAQGLLYAYHQPCDIYKFFQIYAPSKDSNNPKAYAEFVASKVNMPPTTPITELLKQKVAQ